DRRDAEHGGQHQARRGEELDGTDGLEGAGAEVLDPAGGGAARSGEPLLGHEHLGAADQADGGHQTGHDPEREVHHRLLERGRGAAFACAPRDETAPRACDITPASGDIPPPFERQALWSTQGGPRHVTGRRAVSSQGLQPPTNPRENTMDARLNYFADPTAAKALRHLMTAGRTVQESSLPATTQQLVALRVSQINGCAVCVDKHTKEAAAAGETAVRLHLVAVWREAGVFTEAERAALELAEQGTRVADAGEGVSDEV